MKIPETLIIKEDEQDFIGTKIELVRITHGTCATAYYAHMNGTASSIHAIPKGHIHTIVEGKHQHFFTTFEHLHHRVKTDAQRTIDCIDRFYNTGAYFEHK